MPKEKQASNSGPAADTEWLVNQIAHTLRNPIFAAMVQAEALVLRAGEEDRIVKAARMVHKQLKRLEADINEMLLFGRAPRINCRPTDANRLMEQIADSFRRGEREQSAEIEIRSTGGDALEVEWDPDAVTVILDRLLVNSIQHTEPPHRIVVEIGPADTDSMQITIRDHGEGISDSIRERIYLPFYPQHSGRPGLGLAVAAKFTHALGGHLEISSVEGEGTEARVILPKNAPPSAP